MVNGTVHDTPRFHCGTRPWTFGSCPPPREAKLASASRNMNHMAHANEKVRAGVDATFKRS